MPVHRHELTPAVLGQLQSLYSYRRVVDTECYSAPEHLRAYYGELRSHAVTVVGDELG